MNVYSNHSDVLGDLADLLSRLEFDADMPCFRESSHWEALCRSGEGPSLSSGHLLFSLQLVARSEGAAKTEVPGVEFIGSDGSHHSVEASPDALVRNVFRTELPRGTYAIALAASSAAGVAAHSLAADSGEPLKTIPCQTGNERFRADLWLVKDGEAEVEIRTDQLEHADAIIDFRVGGGDRHSVQLGKGRGSARIAMGAEELEKFDGWMDLTVRPSNVIGQEEENVSDELRSARHSRSPGGAALGDPSSPKQVGGEVNRRIIPFKRWVAQHGGGQPREDHGRVAAASPGGHTPDKSQRNAAEAFLLEADGIYTEARLTMRYHTPSREDPDLVQIYVRLEDTLAQTGKAYRVAIVTRSNEGLRPIIAANETLRGNDSTWLAFNIGDAPRIAQEELRGFLLACDEEQEDNVQPPDCPLAFALMEEH